MSEILFGQSYILRFDPKLWREMRPYPPLGCLIAAACARRAGHEVALFDAMLARSEADWDASLDAHQPAIAVLYEDNFNYLSKMCLLRMRSAACAMIGSARRRGCKVLVCGSDASDHPRRYLDAGADFVLVGEGEATLEELLSRLTGASHGSFEDTPGLAFRSSSGELIRTSRRQIIGDLDSLPLPAWDLADLNRYREIWMRRHGYFSLNMATTRGCPFHCNWCAKPIWGQAYHVRSPENVADEMQRLQARYRPDHLWFADDIIALRRGWMEEFAAVLERRSLRIPFKCLSRVDLLLRPNEIESFARAGAETVWVGAESGSQKILDAMDKGTRVEQIHQAARKLRAAGIRVGFFLQFGYPGEGRREIEQTLQMVRECRPDEIGVSVSYPLPGTRFHEMVSEQLRGKQNWVDSDDLDMMYQGPFATSFYRQLHRVVHKEFRLRKHAGELLGALRRPRRLRLASLRQAAACGYHALTLPWERMRMERLAQPQGLQEVLCSGLTPDQAGNVD